ncbi:hypothetical protein bpr_I0695 [Butyrivibrio proteoclasticus B316]|uniref:Uncharacterized protein n=1 Tax=Butyrivibrio proteoclasticus (strain ATCC 51982 / DSM 14932 / B316) TaxID=515622 RepID=E0S0W3_BUTPB|nr:hypothetical protein [Butyrivibrio proteoclasticus]ADL33438.1 hypothetical protein bpr_I0695 [Butyrivibrio proteoclasticus B316]
MKKRYYCLAVIGMLAFGIFVCRRDTNAADQIVVEANAVDTVAGQSAIEEVVELTMADN